MKISATWSSSRIATRVSWALEEMIISLVMPEAPKRCDRTHEYPARGLRRVGGQTYPEHREDAAQDEGEDQRHRRTVMCGGFRLRDFDSRPVTAESPHPEAKRR